MLSLLLPLTIQSVAYVVAVFNRKGSSVCLRLALIFLAYATHLKVFSHGLAVELAVLTSLVAVSCSAFVRLRMKFAGNLNRIKLGGFALDSLSEWVLLCASAESGYGALIFGLMTIAHAFGVGVGEIAIGIGYWVLAVLCLRRVASRFLVGKRADPGRASNFYE